MVTSKTSQSDVDPPFYPLVIFYQPEVQAALAVKRLGPCARCSLTVPAPADPAPCPVFAALSYL